MKNIHMNKEHSLFVGKGTKQIRFLHIFLEYLYPRRCPICHEIIGVKNTYICMECTNKLEVIKEPRCKKCSKPIESKTREYCLDCSNKQLHYDRGYALWVYKKGIKESIYAFKYQNRKEYAHYYTMELLKYYGSTLEKLQLDVVMPIPISRKKKIKRGFNQAELIAKPIAKALGVQIDTKTLIRIKDTTPQKKLNNKDRIKNLEKAFKILKNSVEYKNVLLVDDIYTTGSTISECAKILKASGAERIYYISLCIGKGF